MNGKKNLILRNTFVNDRKLICKQVKANILLDNTLLSLKRKYKFVNKTAFKIFARLKLPLKYYVYYLY